MVAQEKHERLIDAFAYDISEGSAIQVDSCLALRIFVAELQDRGTPSEWPNAPSLCMSSRPRNLPEGSAVLRRSN